MSERDKGVSDRTANTLQFRGEKRKGGFKDLNVLNVIVIEGGRQDYIM